jgi:trimethylamine:corrinoid methyltransferase-like protein
MVLNQERIEASQASLGVSTVDMLLQVHDDALWIMENLGVGCRQPGILAAFREYEERGLALIHESRVYIMRALVDQCLETAPGLADFFVPLNSFFVGGTAPYLYDDEKGVGGVMPTAAHAEQIARIAEDTDVIAGMGRGIKLADECEQMDIMSRTCSKPLYFAVTNDASLKKACEIREFRQDIMIVFCLTRPPLEVNDNFAEAFCRVAQAGLPLFLSAMPMAGISAPYSPNGVLAMTHAEVLFGICAAQLIHPGLTCIHAGFPTIADPRIEYNPNYGLVSHIVLNLLMNHLGMMLDLPACQNAGATHEAHPTAKAYADAMRGQALCKKYGFHMIRHPFAFLRYLIDFSIAKLVNAAAMSATVGPEDAPQVQMPDYDPRAMESIQRTGLGMYMDDP